MLGAGSEELFADMGGLWRRLVGDSQLRWLRPEKGVVHLATAAVVNAVWDLYAGRALGKLLVDLAPEEIDLVDFRYLADALTPAEALGLLRQRAATRPEREALLAAEGYPAYTTPRPAGLATTTRKHAAAALPRGRRRRLHPPQAQGGRSLEDDLRRLGVARAAIGPDRG